MKKKGKRDKRVQKFTTAPKKGERVRVGHGMGGLFGLTSKKTEPDMTPRRSTTDHARRTSRMKRLSGKLI